MPRRCEATRARTNGESRSGASSVEHTHRAESLANCRGDLSLWNGVPNVMTEQTAGGRCPPPAKCSKLRAASLSAAVRPPLKSSTSQLIARSARFIVSVSVRITAPKEIVSCRVSVRVSVVSHATTTALDSSLDEELPGESRWRYRSRQRERSSLSDSLFASTSSLTSERPRRGGSIALGHPVAIASHERVRFLCGGRESALEIGGARCGPDNGILARGDLAERPSKVQRPADRVLGRRRRVSSRAELDARQRQQGRARSLPFFLSFSLSFSLFPESVAAFELPFEPPSFSDIATVRSTFGPRRIRRSRRRLSVARRAADKSGSMTRQRHRSSSFRD